jgi:beta-galactosidase
MKFFVKQILPFLLGVTFYSCNEAKTKQENRAPETEVVSKADLNKFQSHFYLGSHLCREPMPPMEELKRDMETLKRNGFNLIKLQEQWAVDEPEEGKYNFSKYEELISYAKKLGMYVYLGITMEQAPSWLYKKYPDCRMVGRDGATIIYEAQSPIPADGKPGPCFDNPDARAAQIKFIHKLVEALGKYDNVLVWNTWQEIGYWPDRIVGQPVCYCTYTMEAFRNWLKQKYGSLENLNKQWNTNYSKWDYISPSRNFPQKIGIPQNINWSYFIENVKIGNTLKERAAAIRETDTFHRAVFAHLGDWSYGSGKDWNYARSQDFLGSSTYPASNWGEFDEWDDENYDNGDKHDEYQARLNEMWRMLAIRFDYLRSCNIPGHPVWAAEFQGGPVSTGFHKGRVPSAADMRRWMLTAIGSGVNTISFWLTRSLIMTF